METGKKYSDLNLNDYKMGISRIFEEPQNISDRLGIQMDLNSTKHISIDTLKKIIKKTDEALEFSLQKQKKGKKPKNFLKEKERPQFINFVNFLNSYTTEKTQVSTEGK